jgi:hypothetical protein
MAAVDGRRPRSGIILPRHAASRRSPWASRQLSLFRYAAKGARLAERIATALAILLGVAALGLTALWIGNHGNNPTYAAMSHSWDEQYQLPRDTGLLVVANGFYLFADQRRGAPAPTLFVPYWCLVLVSVIWPAWYARRRLLERARRRRESSGMCWCCGYDLRMTPDRCPECGSIPRRASASRQPAPA